MTRSRPVNKRLIESQERSRFPVDISDFLLALYRIFEIFHFYISDPFLVDQTKLVIDADIGEFINSEMSFSRGDKNVTLSVHLREEEERGNQVMNVKAKEIIIVSLILAVWFYSLYRYDWLGFITSHF